MGDNGREARVAACAVTLPPPQGIARHVELEPQPSEHSRQGTRDLRATHSVISVHNRPNITSQREVADETHDRSGAWSASAGHTRHADSDVQEQGTEDAEQQEGQRSGQEREERH